MPIRFNYPLIALTTVLIALAFLTNAVAPYFSYGSFGAQPYYIKVSLAMWHSHNWLALHTYGGLYMSKPPMQFWLTNIVWAIFGLHNWVLRLLPMSFAIGCLWLQVNIFKGLYSKYAKKAWLCALVGLGFFYFLHYSVYYMQDVINLFFILLAVWGLVIARERLFWGLFLFALGNGLGFLTKGPVVLLFTLPPAILLPVCYEGRSGKAVDCMRYYAGILLSLICSIAMLSLWLVPFIQQYYGGHYTRYFTEIVFHHNLYNTPAPFYAYGSAILLLLLPWLVYPYMLHIITKVRTISFSGNSRWLLLSALLSFIILCAIPAKRLRYLLPLVPFISLWLTAYCVQIDEKFSLNYGRLLYRLPFLLCGLAALLLCLASLFFYPGLATLLKLSVSKRWFASTMGVLCLGFAGLCFYRPSKLTNFLVAQCSSFVLMMLFFILVILKNSSVASHLTNLDNCLQGINSQHHPIAFAHTTNGYMYRLPVEGSLLDGREMLGEKVLHAWQQQHPQGASVYFLGKHEKSPCEVPYCAFPSVRQHRYVVCFNLKSAVKSKFRR